MSSPCRIRFWPKLRCATVLATFVCAVLCVNNASASNSSALEKFVSPDGSDQADGSAPHPWRTIQHAADSVSPGVTVHVSPGTYVESVQSKVSGVPPARIRFVSDVKWAAKIVSVQGGDGATWLNSGSYVDIEGFDITGLGAYGFKNIGSYDRLIGNHVHNIPASNCASGGGLVEGGYSLVPLPSHNSYISNLVHDIGGAPGACNQTHGIYLGLPHAIAYNNIVYNSTGRGIQLYHASTDSKVVNNTIFGNGQGIVINADVKAGYMINNSLIANNICYKNVTYGIYSGHGFGAGNQIANNLVFGNGKDWGGGLPHSADVVSDPRFVKPTGSYFGGDYHLQPNSPAIARGATREVPPDDFDGGIRPTGKPIDIGAYQTTATSALKREQ